MGAVSVATLVGPDLYLTANINVVALAKAGLSELVHGEYTQARLISDSGRLLLKVPADAPDLEETDVVPIMGGGELARKLRPMRPGMKVLYMTGYTDDTAVRNGVADGVAALLQKPMSPDKLVSKVRQVLDRRVRRVSGAITVH